MDCSLLGDSNFSWPSLYSPAIEAGFIGSPYRPGGRYLSHVEDVFKYTLYWTLIFHLPLNFVAGVYAFLNFVVPPRARGIEEGHRENKEDEELFRLSTIRSSAEPDTAGASIVHPLPASLQTRTRRTNIRRSRYTFSLLVLLAFLAYGVLSSVLGAAVLAWMIVGVYRAGRFCVSTWIPFVWAVIQSLIALLEIWPSIIDLV